MNNTLNRPMFRAANGAAVQTQGGGYTAAVQRAIAQGDKAGLMEFAKPANYGAALRTPDAQQALNLARRNLGSGKKPAETQVSRAPTIDVADVEQITMGGAPAYEGSVFEKVMNILNSPPSVLAQQGTPPQRMPDAELGIPALVSETSVPAPIPGATSSPVSTSVPIIDQRSLPTGNVRGVATGGLDSLRPSKVTATSPAVEAVPPTTGESVSTGVPDFVTAFPTTSTAQQVSDEPGTPNGATTPTQDTATKDAETAAKGEGAKLTPIQTAFGDLDLSISDTYKPSALVSSLEKDLEAATTTLEDLSDEQQAKIVQAQGRVKKATDEYNTALNEKRTRAKEITMDDVKAEALKIAGVDQGKYDKDRENAIWINMIKSGLAVAAGESENAITNIARGLGVGIEGYGKDLGAINEQEREDRKELRNVQLMLVKNKQDLENAWAVQDNAHRDTILQLRAAEKQGADAGLVAAEERKANTALAMTNLQVTAAKEVNTAKRAERKENADRAFAEWSKKMDTVPDEVWQTVALGGEYAVKDPETGQWSWTEKGEEHYKGLINASNKTRQTVTDLRYTVAQRASSDVLAGYDFTRDKDGNELSPSRKESIALAYEADEVVAQATKAAERAAEAQPSPSKKAQAAEDAREAFIRNWMTNQGLVKRGTQQGTQAEESAASAQGAAPGTIQQPIVLK